MRQTKGPPRGRRTDGFDEYFPSPDKNPDNQVIADRFARLGTIAAILRDAEKRKR